MEEVIECVECGKVIDFYYVKETDDKMRERQMCFKDNFWADLLERDQTGEYVAVVSEKYGHFIPGHEDDSPNSSRGFGGAKVLIKFHTGIEVESTNMWHQGEIPEHWRGEGRFEPNAELEWK